MDPLDFYEFAKEIRSNTSFFPEALKRTILGRIYYAVFLFVRDDLSLSLQSSPLKLAYDSMSREGLIHSLVVDALKEVETSNHLGNVLFGMGRRRRDADYKMHITKNWDREISDSISDAEEVLRNRSIMQTLFSQKGPEIDSLIANWSARLAKGP